MDWNKNMKDLLLVIDMQNVYTKGQKWECPGIENAANKINKIIESGKCENVIFTKFIASIHPKGVWKEYNAVNEDVNADIWANELISRFDRWRGRFPIYSKCVYSSIAIPQVLEAARQARRVIVSGVVAECCVLSTIFQLIDEGIKVIYLLDGVSGLDRRKESATKMILSGLSPLHIGMMTVQEYLMEENS